jgi:PAS domain-containing protein
VTPAPDGAPAPRPIGGALAPPMDALARLLRVALAGLRLGGLARVIGTPLRPPPAGLRGVREPAVWRSAADLLPSPVLILDERGHVLDLNLAAAELAGAERARLRCRPLVDLVEPADRHLAAIVCRRPLRARREWRLAIRTPSSSVPVTFDCWPVRVADAERLLLIGREPGDDRGDRVPPRARVAAPAGPGDGEPALT